MKKTKPCDLQATCETVRTVLRAIGWFGVGLWIFAAGRASKDLSDGR